MKESVIIQKLIQVGQMLERGELEYSGAEIDTKHYLEQYVALRQPHVSRRTFKAFDNGLEKIEATAETMDEAIQIAFDIFGERTSLWTFRWVD